MRIYAVIANGMIGPSGRSSSLNEWRKRDDWSEWKGGWITSNAEWKRGDTGSGSWWNSSLCSRSNVNHVWKRDHSDEAGNTNEYTTRIKPWVEALRLLDDMYWKAFVPDVITYNAAISACGKGQQPQRALHLLAHMEVHGLVPNVITINAAISACEKGQQPEQALQLQAPRTR